MTRESVCLDAEQEQAARVSPDGRQTVVAGPGAGKTEVVAELVRHLVEDYEVYPEDLLVISFSRAAVHAIRRRMSTASELGHLVDVRTLDSLAALIVADLTGEQTPLRGYDATVEAAIRAMQDSDGPVMPDVEHVIVDEAQDVVGLRAAFVATLLDRGLSAKCGYTVLGDPAQALYNFSENGKSQPLIEIMLSAPVEHVELRHHYRARGRAARRHLDVRALMGAASPLEQRLALLEIVADLPDLGGAEGIARPLERWGGTTAVLTRTNAQALDVAGALRGQGVAVSVQRSSSEDSVGAWLGLALGARAEAQVDKETFAAELRNAPDAPGVDDVWPLLRHLSGSRGRTLDTRALAAALASRRPPRAIIAAPQTPLVVSTVHRAKGLEFDNVVLIDPEDWLVNMDDVSEELRVLYVALSRARDRIALGSHETDRQWRRDKRIDRWFKQGFRQWQTFGVELRGSDTRALGPVDRELTPLIGRAVQWHLTDRNGHPTYEASIDGRVVAVTSYGFIGDLQRRLAPRDCQPSRWPTLRGGHLEGLETLADPGRRSTHWPHGLWPSARITGLVEFDWKEVVP
ncbi:UvrD-helicase domain-containing protein [Ornithinimicrobium cerasi]|uniref:DNA 3'-5' helicase n=1 Tax=Ornithinimicrobium cerasi TaxID=2248773 RepID=A0A285VDW4_9MICO|nr:UvrD-helicase domain-containing protein [Ornithinimicrobium cerasi]SOC52332.1 UvrD/REP helicase N-terminal domain-containing protein [Ornithinimicrobium cerasi]